MRQSLLTTSRISFGGDLAATTRRAWLRLPGFANRKLTDEFIVHARQETDAVYTAATSGFTKMHSNPKAFGQGEETSRTVR